MKNAQVDQDIIFCKSCGFAKAAANSFFHVSISLKFKPCVQTTGPEGSVECLGADF